MLAPFRLGRWRVDPRKNLIESHGHRVHVEPKAMRVLAGLARHPGEDVTRESLMEAVWDGGPVTSSALTNAVWELRKALGDNRSEPAFIQTVPGKGYRLVEPTTPAHDRWVPGLRKATVLYALGLILAFLLGLGVASL